MTIDDLLRDLRSSDAAVHSLAAKRLQAKGPASVQPLADFIADASIPEGPKCHAASVLMLLGGNALAAVPALVQGARQSPDPCVRIRCAQALMNIRPREPQILPTLSAALASHDAWIRAETVRIFAFWGRNRPNPEVRAVLERHRRGETDREVLDAIDSLMPTL